MRYQLVIFDFDGTLADSFPWFSRIIDDVADRFRFKRMAPHEMDTLRTMDARALMRHLGVPLWKVPFIAHHMRKRKSRELDQTRPFDGVEAMLRELSDAGIALALVTSNSEPNARAILGAGNASLIRYLRMRRLAVRQGGALPPGAAPERHCGARCDLHRG